MDAGCGVREDKVRGEGRKGGKGREGREEGREGGRKGGKKKGRLTSLRGK